MTGKLEQYFRIIAIVLLLLAPATSVVGGTNTSAEKVASVNDTIITKQDVEQKIIEIRQQLSQQGRPFDDTQLATLENKIIDSLIEEELLFQESQKKIKIDQATVDATLADIRKNFSSEEEFLTALKEMGITKAELIIKMRRGLSISKLIDTQIGDKIQIPETEIRAFYDTHPDYFKMPEQVKASHILIKLDPDADEATRAAAHKKINDAQAQLKKGEPFTVLAQKYSEGPSSSKGGDLGYFGRGQMVKPFEDAAFALKPGETSGIVETRFGLHLIQVTGKKPEGAVPYDDAKERITAHLKREQMKQDLTVYVQGLKEKATIEKFQPPGVTPAPPVLDS